MKNQAGGTGKSHRLIKEFHKWQISIKVCNIKMLLDYYAHIASYSVLFFYSYFVTKLINEGIICFDCLFRIFMTLLSYELLDCCAVFVTGCLHNVWVSVSCTMSGESQTKRLNFGHKFYSFNISGKSRDFEVFQA